MPMNVQPIPTVSERINEIRLAHGARSSTSEILPNENLLWARAARRRVDGGRRRAGARAAEQIKAKVKQAGLWAPHLPAEYGGVGLDFLELAYMNEVLAYASARRRCSAWSRRTRATRRSS